MGGDGGRRAWYDQAPPGEGNQAPDVEEKQTRRERPAWAAGTGKALVSTTRQDAVEEAPRKHQK
jgi:hypothetical protein